MVERFSLARRAISKGEPKVTPVSLLSLLRVLASHPARQWLNLKTRSAVQRQSVVTRLASPLIRCKCISFLEIDN